MLILTKRRMNIKVAGIDSLKINEDFINIA